MRGPLIPIHLHHGDHVPAPVNFTNASNAEISLILT